MGLKEITKMFELLSDRTQSLYELWYFVEEWLDENGYHGNFIDNLSKDKEPIFEDISERDIIQFCFELANFLIKDESKVKKPKESKLIDTGRLELKTWSGIVPEDADCKFQVMYADGNTYLAGLGTTEQEAMINFCHIYLRKKEGTK